MNIAQEKKFSTLTSNFRAMQELLFRYCPDKTKAFEILLAEKEQATRPSILVYGIYNHGKSTLINALLGANSASVANKPETDAITAYQWKGYEIFDTPGIDAPIEHEKITKELLYKSEVVLFVLSSDNIEYAPAWDEIVGMAQRNQQVYIIINDTTGCLDDPRQQVVLNDKCYKNLQEAARKKDYDNILDNTNTPILFVNAKVALNAKLENRSALLNRSNILQVEEKLQLFFETLPAGIQLNTAYQNYKELLEECHMHLLKEEGSSALVLAKKSYERIILVEKNLRQNFEEALEQQLRSLRPAIYKGFDSLKNTSNPDPKTVLLPLMEKLGNDMNSYLQPKIKRAAEDVEALCNEYDTQFKKIQNMNINISSEQSTQDNTSLFDTAKKLVPWESILDTIDWNNNAETIIVETLKFGKDLFPSLFKDVGVVTMAKWAGTLVKYLGPIITILTTIYEIYSSHKQEQEARAAAEREVRALNDATDDCLGEINRAYRNQIDEIIDSMFTPLKQILNKNINTWEYAEITATKDLDSIKNAQAMLTD